MTRMERSTGMARGRTASDIRVLGFMASWEYIGPFPPVRMCRSESYGGFRE